jgi:hypothetical protein
VQQDMSVEQAIRVIQTFQGRLLPEVERVVVGYGVCIDDEFLGTAPIFR